MDDFEACIAHLRLPVTHRGALIRAAERWRPIKLTAFHSANSCVKKELDREYEAQFGLKAKTSKDATQVKISRAALGLDLYGTFYGIGRPVREWIS
jgi:hypothetical protein